MCHRAPIQRHHQVASYKHHATSTYNYIQHWRQDIGISGRSWKALRTCARSCANLCTCQNPGQTMPPCFISSLISLINSDAATGLGDTWFTMMATDVPVVGSAKPVQLEMPLNPNAVTPLRACVPVCMHAHVHAQIYNLQVYLAVYKIRINSLNM